MNRILMIQCCINTDQCSPGSGALGLHNSHATVELMELLCRAQKSMFGMVL